jgi:hypothetical protein
MSSVEKASSIVTQLEQKRSACIRRGTELADERSALAFSAYAENDPKSARKLEEIHNAISVHASTLATLDSTLRGAHARLERARQAEATKADRETAKALKAVGSGDAVVFFRILRPAEGCSSRESPAGAMRSPKVGFVRPTLSIFPLPGLSRTRSM